jgi:protein-tyrosine kinase
MSVIHDSLRKLEQTEPTPLPQVWASAVAMNEQAAAVRTQHTALKDRSAVAQKAPDTGVAATIECRSVSWTLQSSAMLDFESDSAIRATEEFRILRSRLYQARSAQSLKSLLITSAVTGEGKSFVAANLWQVLSLHRDRRVLLMDGDLKTPRLHKFLGTGLTPGLSECLSGEADLPKALQKGDAPNSFFLPAGAPQTRSSDLLSNGRLGPFLQRLVDRFDWVVIDAPAAVETSDACSLAETVEGVLVVVRAKKTPSGLVQKAVDRFAEDRILGVILNEVAATADK